MGTYQVRDGQGNYKKVRRHFKNRNGLVATLSIHGGGTHEGKCCYRAGVCPCTCLISGHIHITRPISYSCLNLKFDRARKIYA
jgi:hypothetical protein